MAAADVLITTFSDADFARAFQWVINGVPFDFTGFGLMLMVRKRPDDAEVFVSLRPDDGDIDFTPAVDGKLTTFNIRILRQQTVDMAPGDYVHSLILLRPDGLRDDIWRGTLTHATGSLRVSPGLQASRSFRSPSRGRWVRRAIRASPANRDLLAY